MQDIKLYCASLIGYDKGKVSTQMTHILAKDDTDAYLRSVKIFENMYQNDPSIKKYISCIELNFVEGHKVIVQ